MEPSLSTVELLFEKVENYGKTSYEISKLKTLETTANMASSLLSSLSVIIMLSFFALVLNIGIAMWLGELLGKSYYGFFIVAGFYLVVGLVFHFFMHSWIKKPVSDLIISLSLQ